MKTRTTLELAEMLVSTEGRLARAANRPHLDTWRRWRRLRELNATLRLTIASRLDGSQIIASRIAA